MTSSIIRYSIPHMKDMSLTVKILTIIGFSATILLIAWALFMLITKGQSYFTSLADRVETLEVISEPEEVFQEEMTEDEPEIPVQEIIDKEESETTWAERYPEEANTPSPQPALPATPRYSDLAITILGNGTVDRGIFTFESEYKSRETNALMVDIQNKGTLTSSTWVFSVTLENNTLYTSAIQSPLRPGEHAVFTIPFETRLRRDATVRALVHNAYDILPANNIDTYEVDMR